MASTSLTRIAAALLLTTTLAAAPTLADGHIGDAGAERLERRGRLEQCAAPVVFDGECAAGDFGNFRTEMVYGFRPHAPVRAWIVGNQNRFGLRIGRKEGRQRDERRKL